MDLFMMGAMAMGSAVAALYFFRFWRETGDRLFAIFALSFLLLGITRLGLAWQQQATEGHTHWYWVRLAAFVLILIAIADKNRRKE